MKCPWCLAEPFIESYGASEPPPDSGSGRVTLTTHTICRSPIHPTIRLTTTEEFAWELVEMIGVDQSNRPVYGRTQ